MNCIKQMNEKKIIITCMTVLLLIAVIFVGIFIWHNREMNSLQKVLTDEQEKKELMSKRIEDIKDKLNSSEKENETLRQQIEELLIEETVVFDAETFQDEIKEIAELASMSYYYTNVGSIDTSKTIRYINIKAPLSSKHVVVSMDGCIKIGIDINKVQITSDETSKNITIEIPKASILSNELFEDTFVPYVEEDSPFNKITVQDDNNIRREIKQKAETKVQEHGLFEDAQNKAGEMIRGLIEAVPGVKDSYHIDIKYQ